MTGDGPQPVWHRRGYLPHFDGQGMHQSVTYRLNDALPRQVLLSLQRQVLAETDGHRSTKLRHLIESYVDAGHGSCILRDPTAADIVIETWHSLAGTAYDLCAWVVMPNHVHLVLRPYPGQVLYRLIGRWKSRSTTLINRALGRRGKLWMPDFWDRYLRDQDHYHRAVHYIHTNPVRAGMVTKPEDWPWSSAARPM